MEVLWGMRVKSHGWEIAVYTLQCKYSADIFQLRITPITKYVDVNWKIHIQWNNGLEFTYLVVLLLLLASAILTRIHPGSIQLHSGSIK